MHDQNTSGREPVPDGVPRRRFLQAAAVGGGLAAGLGSAAAAHDEGDRGNPLAGFGGTACDVPRTSDRYLPFDTGGRFGGWGGHSYHVTEPGVRDGETPVVFVHGNTHDACDFSEHAEAYLDRGYRGDELWSITFRESTSTHAEMARQLDEFVFRLLETCNGTDVGYDPAGTPWQDAVPAWDISSIDVVSHSLGVTGVRLWMADRRRYDWPSVQLADDHPAARPRFDRVDTVVGLAGANDGTYTCGPCQKGTGSGEPCNVISPLCADEPGEPLFDLNHYGADCTASGACESNETPHGDRIDYYTIRGTADYFYTDDPDSPVLAGAESNVVINGAHNATRASDTSIDLIYEWVTDEATASDRGDGPTLTGVSGSRSDDSRLFTGGSTAQVQVAATADIPVLLRDRVPYQWDVFVEDSDAVRAVAPRPHEGVREIYLAAGPARRHDATYFVEAPSGAGNAGHYTFGPAQVRHPTAATWTDVPGTTEENYVLGASF
jgi:triacylglycerol lipase